MSRELDFSILGLKSICGGLACVSASAKHPEGHEKVLLAWVAACKAKALTSKPDVGLKQPGWHRDTSSTFLSLVSL